MELLRPAAVQDGFMWWTMGPNRTRPERRAANPGRRYVPLLGRKSGSQGFVRRSFAQRVTGASPSPWPQAECCRAGKPGSHLPRGDCPCHEGLLGGAVRHGRCENLQQAGPTEHMRDCGGANGIIPMGRYLLGPSEEPGDRVRCFLQKALLWWPSARSKPDGASEQSRRPGLLIPPQPWQPARSERRLRRPGQRRTQQQRP